MTPFEVISWCGAVLVVAATVAVLLVCLWGGCAFIADFFKK